VGNTRCKKTGGVLLLGAPTINIMSDRGGSRGVKTPKKCGERRNMVGGLEGRTLCDMGVEPMTFGEIFITSKLVAWNEGDREDRGCALI